MFALILIYILSVIISYALYILYDSADEHHSFVEELEKGGMTVGEMVFAFIPVINIAIAIVGFFICFDSLYIKYNWKFQFKKINLIRLLLLKIFKR